MATSMPNETSNNTNSNTPRKTDPMDIDVLIDKVSKLPIPDTEKANILQKIKENMMNPARGEVENLNRIQNKYTPPNLLPPQMIPTHTTPTTPTILETLGTPGSPRPAPVPPPGVPLLPSINPLYNQLGMQSLPGDIMTTAHFEVLRNKMDSIQLELVDLLRHVKDYTQRYMNATRLQDLEKIDAYINGLFEVDKKMKEARDKVAEFDAMEEPTEPEQSTVERATSGIKNFLGSIGNGVSSITNLVSNTAKIANDTLSKKVLGGNSTTTNATSSTDTSTAKGNGTGTNMNHNRNIVSVDEYVKSNMNEMEGMEPSNPTAPSAASAASRTTVSTNNINSLKSENHPENIVRKPETGSSTPSEREITEAINRLNDTMSADIENVVKEGNERLNNNSSQPTPTPTQTGGSVNESRLSRKIRMLKLKLTKKKLEDQLKHKTKSKDTKRYVNNLHSVHKTLKRKKNALRK